MLVYSAFILVSKGKFAHEFSDEDWRVVAELLFRVDRISNAHVRADGEIYVLVHWRNTYVVNRRIIYNHPDDSSKFVEGAPPAAPMELVRANKAGAPVRVRELPWWLATKEETAATATPPEAATTTASVAPAPSTSAVHSAAMTATGMVDAEPRVGRSKRFRPSSTTASRVTRAEEVRTETATSSGAAVQNQAATRSAVPDRHIELAEAYGTADLIRPVIPSALIEGIYKLKSTDSVQKYTWPPSFQPRKNLCLMPGQTTLQFGQMLKDAARIQAVTNLRAYSIDQE